MNVVEFVSDPLEALTVTVKFPVGVPVVTLKFSLFETPPPGEGFVTTTGYEPVDAMSLAESEIVSCDAFTKLAVWDTPLKVTVEAVVRPDPLIVSVCDCDPAACSVGDRDVIDGTGLLTGGGVPLPPPPPQLSTVASNASTTVPSTVLRRRRTAMPIKQVAINGSIVLASHPAR